MIKKKVCLLGAFAAGKTSLVRRFARGVFSEKYHSTVGVRIEKKSLDIEGTAMDLILWDLHGEDEFQKVRGTYLRGASGCIYVVDGTRRETANVAQILMQLTVENLGTVPSVIVLNKRDLRSKWQLDSSVINRMSDSATLVETSAKTGEEVDTAFETLARLMLDG